MNREIIFSGNTAEEVAEAFSEIVRKHYLDNLNDWRTTCDDMDELKKWEEKITNEANDIKKEVKKKLLMIVKSPKEYKKFFQKRFGVINTNNIKILNSSEFFKDILLSKSVRYAIPVNVEYIINVRKLTIRKKEYSYKL